jgi:hypothetical protein
MTLDKIIAPNSLRFIADRVLEPVTALSPELLQVIYERIGERERTKYLFDEWHQAIDAVGKSCWLRCAPSEMNAVIFEDPIEGRYYKFVALRQAKVGELGFYQIWELSPPSA